MPCELLTWGRGYDDGCIAELCTIERSDILKYQLAWVWPAFDIEPDYVVAFGEKAVRPASQAAEEVDGQSRGSHATFKLLILKGMYRGVLTPDNA